jgi:nicotinate-nucleotide adenylyltransferase
MKEIGLFFGTFNPFHNGHLFMANYVLNECDLDEIWIVVSPQNPLKKNLEILGIYERIKIIEKSISNKKNIKICLDELKLSKPNYTISTLRFFKKTYSKNKFKIILGEDNLHSFKKWKNSSDILDNFLIYVYPRNKKINSSDFIIHDNLKILNTAPKIDISSTKIRDYLSKGIDVKKYLPKDSFEYILEKKFFRKS